MSSELSISGSCDGSCKTEPFDLEITMAFQPIVDLRKQEIFAYEALVRGADGRSAAEVLALVDTDNMFSFDQRCRVLVIAQAAELKMDTRLSINFIPNAVYEPRSCIKATLAASEEFCFPKERLIFEVLEGERVTSRQHLASIFLAYASFGFMTALDDFGEGFSGLNHLVRLRPDLLKMDMMLVRDIDTDPRKQAVVGAVVRLGRELEVGVVAEGVETEEEVATLLEIGVSLFQG